MTVIVKYVVVRDGKEVMTFATKKEADAHDRLLDIAEQLYEFLQNAELAIADEQLDELAFYLAKQRDQVAALLKGGKPRPNAVPPEKPTPKNKPKSAKNTEKPTVTADG